MFVDILFSVLNFAVLVGLFTYIFFRMFYPQFAEKIATDRRMREELEAQRNGCATRLTAVEEERERREALYRELAHKVADWKQSVADREQALARDQELRDEMARARAEKQVVAFIAQRRRVQVIPQAIAQARLELYEHFQNGSAGENYIDQLVTDMKRRHGDK
jgi:hypothetical protein